MAGELEEDPDTPRHFPGEPARGSGRKGKPVTPETHWRKVAAGLLMSAAGVGVLVADYYIGLDILFNLVLVFLTVRGLSELYDMCETSRTSPFRGFGLTCAVLLVVLHWAGLPGTLPRLLGWADLRAPSWFDLQTREDLVRLGLVAAVLGALWLQATKRQNERTFESISSTLFGLLYCWFLPSFLVKLRHLGSDGLLGGADWNYVGTGLLLSCVTISKISDAGAYFIGRKFGRHVMILRISPKKTYEGGLAGLAASLAAAFAFRWIGWLPFGPWWEVAVFAILVGAMGQVGDLAESLLKRGSGRKDSGDLVPGFGGVLDIVDSLLLSAPVAYFVSILFLRLGA